MDENEYYGMKIYANSVCGGSGNGCGCCSCTGPAGPMGPQGPAEAHHLGNGQPQLKATV